MNGARADYSSTNRKTKVFNDTIFSNSLILKYTSFNCGKNQVICYPCYQLYSVSARNL